MQKSPFKPLQRRWYPIPPLHENERSSSPRPQSYQDNAASNKGFLETRRLHCLGSRTLRAHADSLLAQRLAATTGVSRFALHPTEDSEHDSLSPSESHSDICSTPVHHSRTSEIDSKLENSDSMAGAKICSVSARILDEAMTTLTVSLPHTMALLEHLESRLTHESRALKSSPSTKVPDQIDGLVAKDDPEKDNFPTIDSSPYSDEHSSSITKHYSVEVTDDPESPDSKTLQPNLRFDRLMNKLQTLRATCSKSSPTVATSTKSRMWKMAKQSVRSTAKGHRKPADLLACHLVTRSFSSEMPLSKLEMLHAGQAQCTNSSPQPLEMVRTSSWSTCRARPVSKLKIPPVFLLG